uniref:Uncharacterized protein n=1 Tax=Anguilla anguilla TaxID=7936 RepID=A0A0E9QZV8_ANGAN
MTSAPLATYCACACGCFTRAVSSLGMFSTEGSRASQAVHPAKALVSCSDESH